MFAGSAIAQGGHAITATVVDSEGSPIDFGNVLILDVEDSSMVKGDLFEEGMIDIQGIYPSDFIVKIVVLGYGDQFVDVTDAPAVAELGEIQMGQSVLDGVEVVATKPTFTRRGDVMVVNVETSDLSTSGTALDVLRRTPQVIVDGQDNIMIFGKGAPTIYVDGQLVTSIEVLKNLSSDDVKEIEVIRNPSAKYDAEGTGGVINIITKSNDLEGFNGSVYQNVTKASYWRTFTSFQLAYKKGDLNVYGAMRNFIGAGTNNDEYFRTLGVSPSITTMKNELESVWDVRYSPGYRFGIDYDLNENSRIGFQVKGYLSSREDHTTNSNLITDPTDITQLFTQTNGTGDYSNTSLNLNYLWSNDSLGHELFTAVDYAFFDSKTVGDIDEDIEGQFNTKRSTGIADIAILTGKTDYTKRWIDRNLTFEAGIKYAVTTNLASVLFEEFTGGSWVPDPSITNGFEFDESVGAGYMQFSGSIDQFDFRAGIRAEHTSMYGYSETYQQEVIDTNYLNFFPSGYLGYNFSEDLTFGVTYTSRINRPNYGDLDPFVDYLDSVSAMIGNPLLQPEFATSVEASLIYLQYASIDFSYSRTRDAMYMIIEQTPQGGVIAQTRNVDYDESYLLGINLPYEFPWWLTYNAFGYSWNSVQYTDAGAPATLSKPFWYLYLYNEFRFPHDINLEITYEHYSAGIDGIFEFNPIDQLSASISKKFFDEQLTVRFMANDIFHSYREKGSSTLENFHLLYDSRYDSNTFTFAINFNFGRLKSPDTSDKSTNRDEMDRLDTN